MPRVISQCDTLFNGVSQQEPAARLPNQAEEQLNMESSVLNGVSRRQPAKLVKRLIAAAGDTAGSKIHFMRRASGRLDAAVLLPDESIRVFDQDGVEKSIWKQRRWRVSYEHGVHMDQLTPMSADYEYGIGKHEQAFDSTSRLNPNGDTEPTLGGLFVVLSGNVPESWEDADTVELKAGSTTLATGTILGGYQRGERFFAMVPGTYPTLAQLPTLTTAYNTTRSSSATVEYVHYWDGASTYRETDQQFYFACHVDGPHGDNGAQTGTIELVVPYQVDSVYCHPATIDPETWTAATRLYGFWYYGGSQELSCTLTGPAVPHFGPMDLASALPQQKVKALTLNDYTFLSRSDTKVEKLLKVDTPAVDECMLWVKQSGASFSFDISIEVPGVALYEINLQTHTSAATEKENVLSFNTNGVAEILYSALATTPRSCYPEPRAMTVKKTVGGVTTSWVWSTSATEATYYAAFGTEGLLGTDFTVEWLGSTVYLRCNDPDKSYVVAVSDSLGNDSIVLARKSVQSITDLPPVAHAGFVCKVLGSDESAEDDYYVVFKPNEEEDEEASGMVHGLWHESAAPDSANHLDHLTMPWALIRCGDGTFVYSPLDWVPRGAGDADSNPDPSFVGTAITGMFFWKNRLGFITEAGSTIMSEIGEFFHFYRKTMLSLLDSDVIDQDVGLRSRDAQSGHGILAESLVIFAPFQQYSVRGGQALTPSTVSVTPTTFFDVAPVDPVSVGNTIFFVSDNGTNSAVYQYYAAGDTGLHDAVSVSRHVSRYISEGILEMAASPTSNTLVAHAGGNTLWVYRWYLRGQELAQAAWSTYAYSSDVSILGAQFIDDALYLMIDKGGDVLLCTQRMEQGGDLTDEALDTEIHFDFCVHSSDLTAVYDAEDDVTTVTGFAYPLTSAARLLKLGGEAPETVEIISQSADQLIVSGNLSSSAFWVGETYQSEYTFSMPMPRDGQQNAIAYGVSQVLGLVLYYASSGEFTVECTKTNRTGAGATTSRALAADLTGTKSGTMKIPVRGDNRMISVTVKSDSWLPFAIARAEWELLYERYGS